MPSELACPLSESRPHRCLEARCAWWVPPGTHGLKHRGGRMAVQHTGACAVQVLGQWFISVAAGLCDIADSAQALAGDPTECKLTGGKE